MPEVLTAGPTGHARGELSAASLEAASPAMLERTARRLPVAFASCDATQICTVRDAASDVLATCSTKRSRLGLREPPNGEPPR